MSQTRHALEQLWIEAKWRSYADDPVAFFRDCVHVERPGSATGRAPFEPFDYQLEDLDAFQRERYVVVLKARQLGLTTLAMAYAFWLLMFRPGSNIILVSKDRETSESALAKTIEFFYRHMPRWTHSRRPSADVQSAKELTYVFPDGMRSRIISRAPSKTAGAGEVATLVLWDEAALPDVRTPGIGVDIHSSLMATIDTVPDGAFIAFSTARGGHNQFAQLYRRGAAGVGAFHPIFHPWYVSPFLNPLRDRLATCPNGPCPDCVDERIRDEKKLDFVKEPWRFHAEYPADPEEAFRMSGRTRFRGLPPVEEFSDLGWRGRMARDPLGNIELIPDPDGPLRLDLDAVQRGGPPAWSTSALSMDPAGGNGGDYIAMVGGYMTREGHPKIIAYWHANDIEPAEAARHADLLGRWLEGADRRPALLTVEAAGGHGETPIYLLANDLDYPNQYVHRYTGHRRYKREVRFGMPMTPQRRPLVVDALSAWLRYDVDDLPVIEGVFPMLRHELGAFVVGDDGIPRADVGMNDDLVMATAIWVYTLIEEVGPPEQAAVTPAPRDEGHVHRIDVEAMFRTAERTSPRADREYARRVTLGRGPR